MLRLCADTRKDGSKLLLLGYDPDQLLKVTSALLAVAAVGNKQVDPATLGGGLLEGRCQKFACHVYEVSDSI